MATPAKSAILKSPSAKAQIHLRDYVHQILTKHRDRHELREKMRLIDVAYARYTELASSSGQDGGSDSAAVILADEMAELRDNFVSVTVPLLVSQVDTFVAYASEIYLTGAPIFGVVSDNQSRKAAQYIEAMLGKHARISQYSRQLQMFFRDCGKYNFAPLLVEWDTIEHYSRTSQREVTLDEKPTLSTVRVGYNKIKRLDPYNTFADNSVLPGDVARDGDYAGYVELLTKPKLRRLLKKLKATDSGFVVNMQDALDSKAAEDKSYMEAPKVSRYVGPMDQFDWDVYLSVDGGKGAKAKSGADYGSRYEVAHAYIRCEASDFGLSDAAGEHIYKIILVNGQHVVYLERVYTAFDNLPVLIGQPSEDGLGMQTQSIAEAAMPMQEAASALVNIRFHAARRTIADRALYDENAIDPDEVNDPSATAKIPVKTNTLTGGKLSDMYHSIPFHDTATGGLLGDAQAMSDWTSDLNGLNRATQGRFTKGNRTQGEFQDVMSNGEQRQRLPILILEDQVFTPAKHLLMLNVMRYASDEVVQAQDTGKQLQVDVNELTNTVLDFKVADGYLPKSKLANTDLLTAMMTQIGTNQILAASYGPHLPEMFAHMAAMGGITGLDQYAPANQEGAANGQPTTPEATTTEQA